MRDHVVLDGLPCGVVALDPSLRVVAWNEAMELLTGFGREQTLGRPIAEVLQLASSEGEGAPIDVEACLTAMAPRASGRSAYLRDAGGGRRLVFVQGRSVGGFAARGLGETAVHYLTVSDISEEVSCGVLAPRSTQGEGAFQGIIGRDERMQELFRLVRLAAESSANVLVSGESGTGKELVARAIHALSDRAAGPFVAVNCSALPETLLESELFGHVRGAFTGAYRDKEGKFELASGGTIFLDEIGDISPSIQVKLLRVIQEKIIERVGSNERVSVDIRIIAATHRSLRDLVSQGLFREDLYYRLKVFPITVPPLRDRKGDIPLLAEHFVGLLSRRTGRRITGVTEDAMSLLMDYCWPGNVRELENCFEYAFVVCRTDRIDVFDLPQEIRVAPLREQLCAEASRRLPTSLAATLAGDHRAGQRRRSALSRDQILQALEAHGWNRSAAARALGVSRVGLWKRMKSLGIGPSPRETHGGPGA